MLLVDVPADHVAVVDGDEPVGLHVAPALGQRVREKRPHRVGVALPAVVGGPVDDVPLGVEGAQHHGRVEFAVDQHGDKALVFRIR